MNKKAYLKGKTKARQKAIGWQYKQATKKMSYAELLKQQSKFAKLGEKYGLLKEFKANGIL